VNSLKNHKFLFMQKLAPGLNVTPMSELMTLLINQSWVKREPDSHKTISANSTGQNPLLDFSDPCASLTSALVANQLKSTSFAYFYISKVKFFKAKSGDHIVFWPERKASNVPRAIFSHYQDVMLPVTTRSLVSLRQGEHRFHRNNMSWL